jgi:hypothetical protein
MLLQLLLPPTIALITVTEEHFVMLQGSKMILQDIFEPLTISDAPNERLFAVGVCPKQQLRILRMFDVVKKTPWPESASELYRQRVRRLSAK